MIEPGYLFTVILQGSRYRVRYMDFQEVKLLEGTFTSEDEAIQAFEAHIGKAHSVYLQPQRFSMNVRSLAQYKRCEKAKEAKLDN